MSGIARSINIKSGRNTAATVECRRSAIGHMHLVAEFFNEQAKRVRAVAVVIDHENPKRFPCPWHKLPFFRQSHELSPGPESRIGLRFMGVKSPSP